MPSMRCAWEGINPWPSAGEIRQRIKEGWLQYCAASQATFDGPAPLNVLEQTQSRCCLEGLFTVPFPTFLCKKCPNYSRFLISSAKAPKSSQQCNLFLWRRNWIEMCLLSAFVQKEIRNWNFYLSAWAIFFLLCWKSSDAVTFTDDEWLPWLYLTNSAPFISKNLKPSHPRTSHPSLSFLFD